MRSILTDTIQAYKFLMYDFITTHENLSEYAKYAAMHTLAMKISEEFSWLGDAGLAAYWTEEANMCAENYTKAGQNG